MRETYDPKLRWNVIQIDHNEQDKGGKFGKRRIMNREPLRREKAENLLVSCEEREEFMSNHGKNNRTYIVEVADEQSS